MEGLADVVSAAARTVAALAVALDAREAWEARAPTSWIDDPRRWFACEACDGGRLDATGRRGTCAACGGAATQAYPTTRRAVEVYAHDPEAIATAEALARECARRLEPWGVRTLGVVHWRLVDPFVREPSSVYGKLRAFDAPATALILNGSRGWNTTPFDRPLATIHEWLDARATSEVLCSDWQRQARAGRKAHPDAGRDAPAGLGKTRLRDLPNPFAPLVDLWRHGFALEGVSARVIEIAYPIASLPP